MKRALNLAANGVLVLAVLALVAAVNQEGYVPTTTAPTQYAYAIDSASPLYSDTPKSNVAGVTSRALATYGNPTAAVEVDFSSGAGTTQRVYCYTFQQTGTTWRRMGVQFGDAEGTAVEGIGDGASVTSYTSASQTLFFDTVGAQYYELRWGAPSAGLTRIDTWRYGSASR